jgi:hypothetical protein
MAKFFTSPGDLADWVLEAGSPDKAIDRIGNLPGVEAGRRLDIEETVKRIFSKADAANAAEVLNGILAGAGITEEAVRTAEAKADKAQAIDDLRKSGVITSDEHSKMIKEAQIMRQPGEYVMPLRFCPKLPKQSAGQGLISTYNCRHYCLDSIVLDDDPERVYCAEAMWRRHVMDKFSREWKDRETGRWVGGYINDRFHVFPTAGTPANKDVDTMGGNQMELRPDERTRIPRPHQWSTERRLQEQREKGSGYDLTVNTFGKQVVKKAAADGGLKVDTLGRHVGLDKIPHMPKADVVGLVSNDPKDDVWRCPSCSAVNVWSNAIGEVFAQVLGQEVYSPSGSAFDNVCGKCHTDFVRWDSPIRAEVYTHEPQKRPRRTTAGSVEEEIINLAPERTTLSEKEHFDGDDIVKEAFTLAVDLKEQGLGNEDAAVEMANKLSIPVAKAVAMQSAALRKFASHVSDAYEMEKAAVVKPMEGKPAPAVVPRKSKLSKAVEEDAAELGLTDPAK